MSQASYRIELTRPALRDLHSLPTKIADPVLRFLDGPLTENPLRVTKALYGELAGTRSGYVGISYRVLVQVAPEVRIVYVIRIAHRANAYR